MHLKLINKKYIEHLIGAWSLAFKLLLTGLICFIHGIFPDFAVHYTSNKIKKLNKEI